MSEVGQQLIEAVRRHAGDRPDYVYEPPINGISCVYVFDGCPSCLIGQALWDLGLIDADVERLPGNRAPAGVMINDSLKLRIEREERKWLSDVQYAQDRGKTWGNAVSYADAGGTGAL